MFLFYSPLIALDSSSSSQ